MRAVRVLYYYATHQFDTGSPRSLATLIQSLDRKQYEPLFWATGDGPLVDELERRHVTIVRGPVGSLSRRRPLRGLRSIWEKARTLRELDVGLVHINDYGWNEDLVLGAALAHIPVVLHARTPPSGARWNLNVQLARAIVFNSKALRDSVSFGPRALRKSAILYPNVDLETYRSGASIRDQLGLRDSDVVIGTISQLSARKGIDTLVEVARVLLARHRALQFVIAGRAAVGEQAFADAMIGACERDPLLRSRVRFLGSRNDVPDLLASIDILFHPARAEPFGRVIVEGMAAGLPVVASAVDGISEIITSRDLGCLEPPDAPGRFAEALSALVMSRERRVALGRAGLASLTGRFDRDTYCRALHTIYSAVRRTPAGLVEPRRSARELEVLEFSGGHAAHRTR